MWYSSEGRDEDAGFGEAQNPQRVRWPAREYPTSPWSVPHFDDFSPQEQEKQSTQMALDLLSGKTYIRGVDKGAGDDGERYVFDFDRQPRPTLSDLRLLAIEVLKERGQSDPALVAAFLDECMQQQKEPDLPVTRDWIESLPCGFSDQGLSQEIEALTTAMLMQNNRRANPVKIYFLISHGHQEPFGWGFCSNGSLTNFKSVPTRPKVFSFCNAVGINLMEKS